MSLNQNQYASHYKGIGGSNAAAACGLDPFKTRLHLYMQMIEPSFRDDMSDNEFVRWGNLLEETVAQEATRRLTCADSCITVDEPIVSPDIDWMIANPDRFLLNKDAEVVGGLEIKNRSAFKAVDYKNDEPTIPEYYQCLHYMIVTGLRDWYLAVLLGGNDLRIMKIIYDDHDAEKLIDLECEFMDHITENVPPEPDYEHEDTFNLLKRINPFHDDDSDDVIDLESIKSWHDVATESKKLSKEYASTERVATNHILQYMCKSRMGIIPGVGTYTRSKVKKKGFFNKPTSYEKLTFKKQG